eukprot:TRINITY_DN16829_c0_g1_i1.p1 TRINITY_DN16829_c0_g1~~TRINITY_DN16829_c0_g1_i1.p1  ORF type:complete len:289 (+),score=34.43 TRINITY_DN16829_c0_g1_i1:105-971(+)
MAQNYFDGFLPSFFSSVHNITGLPAPILIGNLFNCPLPANASVLFGATCRYAEVTSLDPAYGDKDEYSPIKVVGTRLTSQVDKLTCVFNNTKSKVTWADAKGDTIVCPSPPQEVTGYVSFDVLLGDASIIDPKNSVPPFLYYTTPTLTSMSATSWRQQGSLIPNGKKLTIEGTLFAPTGLTSCRFGGLDPLDNYTQVAQLLNETKITCFVPEHAPETVYVYVTNDQKKFNTNVTSGQFIYYKFCDRFKPHLDEVCNDHGVCINDTVVPYCQCRPTYSNSTDGCSNCIN